MQASKSLTKLSVLLAAAAGLLGLTGSAWSAPASPPTLVSIDPLPGVVDNHLKQVTVEFSEPVTGVDIDDLLLNGLPMIGISVDDTGTRYSFSFPKPSFGPLHFTWTPTHGITDLGNPATVFDATAGTAIWDYDFVDTAPPTLETIFPEPNAIVRSLSQVEVLFSEDVQGVDAGDLLINGFPAVGLTRFSAGRYLFQFASPGVGLVRLQWIGTSGITDLAASPHPFAGGAWTVRLDPTAPHGDLVINEILAANHSGLVDEDSTASDPQPQDWIEIYNRGTSSVDLSGWSLSDDPSTPGLWVFPSGVLAPGQYLVVFASGKDRRSPTDGNRFHTNFKLSPQGEFLGLYTPDSPRVLASGFDPSYPEQRNDFSYGRDVEGNLNYFSTPTPGAANAKTTLSGVCAPVHFSAGRGHYTVPFSVLLSTETPGAFIRYTLDGSEPTLRNGVVYLSPIAITKTTILRAAAFRDALLPSTLETHTYLFKQPAGVRSLPIVSIVTAANNLTGPTGILGIGPNYDNPNEHGIAWERPTSVEFINLKDNSGFHVDCGLRVQGSDYTRPRYTADSKFAYRLYFRGDYGQGRLDYPFFADSPLQSYDQIVLRAGHNDEVNPFLTDDYVRQIASDIGLVSCHGNFVNLFVNGVYKGYYNPTERVEEPFLQAYQGGSDQWDVITVGSVAQGGDTLSWNALLSYVRQQNITAVPVYQEVMRRLDVTNFVDYLFVNIHAATWDWPHNNFRAARERVPTGLWRFYVWDAEGGYLSNRGPDFNQLTSSDSGFGASSEIADLFNRLRLNSEFRLLFADRVHKHWFNNGPMAETNMSSRFIEMRAELAGVISGFDSYILNSWIPKRRTPLTAQLTSYKLFASSNAPTMNQFGGRVPSGFSLTLTNRGTNSVIYYTLNGEDPRVQFTGAVGSGAVLYENPLALIDSVAVNARTLQNGTNWSALSSASFLVDSRGIPLRITEIMYNPLGGTPYEFIELQNIGGVRLDLSGISFDGVIYTFPVGSALSAGARLVLSADIDPNAFKLRYPGVTLGGSYGGSLNNGGERLALRDRAGRVIVSVDYRDDQGWPRRADGEGYSLEIIDPRGDPDAAANWQASQSLNGTPGAAPSLAAPPSVRLNEIQAASAGGLGSNDSDWVELRNLGSSSANLANWSLTDDGNPRKFVFPAGTVLAAGGYLRVWCDAATNSAPGLHTDFALGSGGESLFLWDSSTNKVDAVTFGAQLPGYTLGLTEDGYRLNTPTPNASNLAVTTGAVTNLTLNEWMSNPQVGSSSWVELLNRSPNEPVALQNIYIGGSNSLQQLTTRSFLAPGGFLRLFADPSPGADHLDIALAAGSGSIVLYDTTGAEFERINYSAQSAGVSAGRLPDGSSNFSAFPGSASPGATNYLNAYSGPVLNEALVRNVTLTNEVGWISYWFELYHGGAEAFDLSGMSISLDAAHPGDWVFPPGTTIAAGGFRTIWCDGSRPASVTTETRLNIGHSLNNAGGGIYLFNANGQPVNQVEYGFQLADLAIGLDAGIWRLLSLPTPGASNSTPRVMGSSAAVRLNEWMANPWSGDDWFEVYNTTNQPIDLGGLVLSDDPSSAYTNKFRLRPLTFVGGNAWAKWTADANPDAGPDHVNFALDAMGDALRIYSTNGAVIDAVDFGRQARDISSGRFPDGQTNVVFFPDSSTPDAGNHFALHQVVISEFLANAEAPLEDAIELQNVGATEIAIGGWYLSNDPLQLKKFQLPSGTALLPGGFAVFYENQFNDGTPMAFELDGIRGGEIWLSASDANGDLTGEATSVAFRTPQPQVSYGLHSTPLGFEYVALSRRTFGADEPASVSAFRLGTGLSNSAPRVGPLVLSEIMYHPLASGARSVEYLEFQNISSSPLSLGSVAPLTPGWELRGAVDFIFPSGTLISPGERLLLVDFSPTSSPSTLQSFRSAFSIPLNVKIYGPFHGRLSNDGEDLSLWQPLSLPVGSSVTPYARVEHVTYSSLPPWPIGEVNGGGLSLQRRSVTDFSNDPRNWTAAMPTPGFANGAPAQGLPTISTQPIDQSVFVGEPVSLVVGAEGPGPQYYQWRFNGRPLNDATNAELVLPALAAEDSGSYDVFVSNAAGSVFSRSTAVKATFRVALYELPRSQIVKAGTNVSFNVVAAGRPPLIYQWRFNGVDIEGARSNSLTRLQVGQANSGLYTVMVSDAISSLSASASLEVVFPPIITLHPQPQTVLVGDTVRFTAAATGSTPMTFRWRKSNTVLSNIVSTTGSSVFTITNAKTTHSGNYLVVITNLASSSGALSVSVPLTVLVDTDKDRMPDVWELANNFDPKSPDAASLDTDGDGLTNLEEYMAGTDPRDPASFLRVERVSADLGSFAITFNAVSNRTYSVLYKEDPTELSWSVLATTLGRITNRLETVIDPVGTNISRIYRLRTPSQ